MNAVAAKELYGAPCIVVDFGTSTNFDVVSPEGEYVGGVLAPGIEVSMEALIARAARLLKVDFVEPPAAIGKTTATALQSGVVYGFAGQVDGIVAASATSSASTRRWLPRAASPSSSRRTRRRSAASTDAHPRGPAHRLGAQPGLIRCQARGLLHRTYPAR